MRSSRVSLLRLPVCLGSGRLSSGCLWEFCSWSSYVGPWSVHLDELVLRRSGWGELPGLVPMFSLSRTRRVLPSAKTVGASTRQCVLESLTRKTSYSVWVMASTSVGGLNSTRINFKTLSISE